MPSWELFEAQEQEYRDEVLPPAVTARVAVEAAAPLGWDRYAGPTGEIIAMRGFGASAPIRPADEAFGFTAEHVLEPPVASSRAGAAAMTTHCGSREPVRRSGSTTCIARSSTTASSSG